MSRVINTFKNMCNPKMSPVKNYSLLINQANDVQTMTLFDFSHSVLELFFPTSAHLIKNIKRADCHS